MNTFFATYNFIISSVVKDKIGANHLNNEDKITSNNNIDDCLFFES